MDDLANRLERLERRSRFGWIVAGGLALMMGLGFRPQSTPPESYVLADGKGRVCRITAEGVWVGRNQRTSDDKWQVVWTTKLAAEGIDMKFGRAQDDNSFTTADGDRSQIVTLSQDEGLRIARWDFARNVGCETGMAMYQDEGGVVTPHMYAKVQGAGICLVTERGPDVRR